MSLTSILKDPKYRAKFAERFPMPEPFQSGEIKAEPLTRQHALVGAASDYVLRFEAERLIPSKSGKWVAYNGLVDLCAPYGYTAFDGSLEYDGAFAGQLKTAGLLRTDGLVRKIIRLYSDAVENHDAFLRGEPMTDELIASCAYLAQMDAAARAGPDAVFDNLGAFESIDPEVIRDIKNVLVVARRSGLFTGIKSARLNPSFGEASVLVGGADADMMLDHALIDVKTVRTARMTRDAWNQIIGYYMLSLIHDEKTDKGQFNIDSIGIYFARHGTLVKYPVDILGDMANITKWFVQNVPSDYSRWIKKRVQNSDA